MKWIIRRPGKYTRAFQYLTPHDGITSHGRKAAKFADFESARHGLVRATCCFPSGGWEIVARVPAPTQPAGLQSRRELADGGFL